MALYFEGKPFFFLLHYQGDADHMHGGRYVEREGFSIGTRNQDRGLRQKLLDHVKCLLGLGRPFKMVGLLHELIEGDTSFAEA